MHCIYSVVDEQSELESGAIGTGVKIKKHILVNSYRGSYSVRFVIADHRWLLWKYVEVLHPQESFWSVATWSS